MSTVGALQTEREAILSRMHSRRASYRRMLNDGGDFEERPAAHQVDGTHIYSYEHAEPLDTPHNPVLRVIKEHPFLCALGVAALIMIGPKRIMRAAATGSAAAGALSARNNSNVDMIGRLLTMAGAYAQGRSNK